MEDLYNETFAIYEYGEGFSKESFIRDRINHPRDKEVGETGLATLNKSH